MRKGILLLMTICMGQIAYAGGGWPAQKGKGFLKLSEYFIRSDGYFTPNGDVTDIATAGIYITSLYAEYGVTDRFTAIAYVPFFSRATLNEQVDLNGTQLAPGDAVNSFGDTDITLKYGLLTKGPIVMSASVTFGFPFGNNAGGDTGVLQTGDGEFNVFYALEASRGLNEGKGYINTLIGFNDRSNNFSDEFRWGVEVGHRITDRLNGAIKIFSVNSLNNGSDLETPSNGIFSNNIEYVAYTPELNYKVRDNWGISVSVGGAFSAKRILAAPGYSIGAYLSF